MAQGWEYKVVALKRERGSLFALTPWPSDEETTRILNREGAGGWELVNIAFTSLSSAPRMVFKRPR